MNTRVNRPFDELRRLRGERADAPHPDVRRTEAIQATRLVAESGAMVLRVLVARIEQTGDFAVAWSDVCRYLSIPVDASDEVRASEAGARLRAPRDAAAVLSLVTGAPTEERDA